MESLAHSLLYFGGKSYKIIVLQDFLNLGSFWLLLFDETWLDLLFLRKIIDSGVDVEISRKYLTEEKIGEVLLVFSFTKEKRVRRRLNG